MLEISSVGTRTSPETMPREIPTFPKGNAQHAMSAKVVTGGRGFLVVSLQFSSFLRSGH